MDTQKLFRKFFFSLVFLFTGFVFASDWTLAAQKFTFTQKGMDTGSNEKIASVLPQLILEQIALNGIRTLPAQEQLDRELNTLQTERLSLFLQLSKENKTRDALVLSKDKPNELRKAIEEEDEKIAEIEKQIDQNIQNALDAKEKYEKKILAESGESIKNEEGASSRFNPMRPFPFFRRDEEEKPETETVVLYKNDSSQLYSPSAQAAEDGIDSFAFNKEAVAAKVNGLLSGEITLYRDYAAVSVNLYLFPGATLYSTVTEVGNASDLISIAQNVARSLAPKIANCLPVKIRIEIEPAEARSSAVVSIDGIILPKTDEDLSVDAGIHSITISADGYESRTIRYSFSGEDFFTVQTTLQPLVTGSLEIRLKKMTEGLFYFNALDTSAVSMDNPYASASVNGKPVLGVFSLENGDSAFVYIPVQLAQDGNILSVNAKPYDREKNIDMRRRRMYTAYSVLICALVPTFYTIGNFTAYNKSYSSGRSSYDEVTKWQRYSYYSIGASCVAGAWFAFEMVRYLFAANEVLPATAKASK